jgi:predicted negative regulator of RcsB-dependent stress response
VSEHLTKKDMRTDAFSVAVEHKVEYLAEHRKQLIQYGVIALVVILAAVATYAFIRHQKSVREEQLADAITIQETQVTPGAQPAPGVFGTEAAKTEAAQKAFTAVAAKEAHTREGEIAEYYLGCIAADAGKLDEARKHYQSVVDGGDKDYASLANLSLAEVDFMQNRGADGEKILRQLIDHPTIFVTKDQAAISLARHLARTNPAEARKLLEPIMHETGPNSQVAVSVLSDVK